MKNKKQKDKVKQEIEEELLRKKAELEDSDEELRKQSRVINFQFYMTLTLILIAIINVIFILIKFLEIL